MIVLCTIVREYADRTTGEVEGREGGTAATASTTAASQTPPPRRRTTKSHTLTHMWHTGRARAFVNV